MKVTDILETMDYGKPRKIRSPLLNGLKKRNAVRTLYQWRIQYPRRPGIIRNPKPATGEVLATICQAQLEDVDLAMQSARSAQAQWEGMGGPARAKFLYAIARLVQKHSRLFAVIETLDNGKPIRKAAILIYHS